MCHALGLGSGCSNKVPESGGSSVIEVYLSQSWGLQVWDQGASRVEFWWEPSSGLQTASVSLCPHMVESTDDAKCLVSLMKTVMLCMRNPLLTSLTLMISLISHLLIWSHCGGRFQYMNLGNTHTFNLLHGNKKIPRHCVYCRFIRIYFILDIYLRKQSYDR